MTEQEAWQKIYDAFERYANGDFNRLAAFGICGALHKLGSEDRVISEKTYWTMDKKLCAELIKLGFEPLVICWPTTPEGAASRCEFIREHFLPAGTSESTEAVRTIKPSNPTQS